MTALVARQGHWSSEAKLFALLGRETNASAHSSASVGSAHAGRLSSAVQLPPHAAYAVRDSSRAWGTPDTIQFLVHAFDQVRELDPAAPPLRVHDLSLRQGGPMAGHKSHQSGRDVDLTYYQHRCAGACPARTVTPTELDAPRQWRLLQHWLTRGAAEFIFVDYSLQRPLYEAARASGASARQLASWFQYPRGARFPAGIIRHAPNHANHVHVRFRCAASDRQCAPTATRRVGPSPAGGDFGLLQLLESEAEHEMLELLAD